MKLNIIKYLTVVLSLTVFIISLTKNAVIIDYQNISIVPSFDYFIMGSTALLGGGLLEEIIWLANPLCLISIFLLLYNNKAAKKLSLIALVIAASFSTWKEILGAENGAMARIISLESGYYLWILSIFILTSGTHIYFKIAGPDLDKLSTFQLKKPRIF